MSARVRTACTECGWTGRSDGYRSPAQADYAYARHSCEKTRRDRAAYRRGMAREAAVDRTPKPCSHKVARHEHGTHACYVLDRCKCLPCTAANSQYEADRARRIAYGQTTLTDADPVRQHVAALADAGMGLKRLAALSGVAHGALWKLVYGKTRPDGTRTPSKRVRNETAAAILAVAADPSALSGGVTVDGTGTRRRLEALVALGWSVQRLADEHGLDRQGMDRALSWQPVRASTARAVRAMYEAVGDARPTATTRGERVAITRSLRRAAEHGWPVPAMWDDDALDDPYAEPARAEDRGARVDLDEWLHLVRGGEDPARAARRCGVTLSGVERAAYRHDRADVLAWITGEAA